MFPAFVTLYSGPACRGQSVATQVLVVLCGDDSAKVWVTLPKPQDTAGQRCWDELHYTCTPLEDLLHGSGTGYIEVNGRGLP